ncbi:hypothetical protein RCC89_05010 [Cytophagaceae bacterium ABcell3]|nr:hypothetical protein RCC89_05010 [Cytophagaceae bacterium ABcell3]
MRLRLLFLMYLLGATFLLKAQSGIKITDGSDLESHPDILFHAEAVNEPRGVLFPRMTHQQMLNIHNPKEGLMVYVTDNTGNAQGMWFYDSYDKEWKRYTPVDNSPRYVEPEGSIIIYTGNLNNFYGYDGQPVPQGVGKGLGKEGTDMEGWAICNGNNLTPNLSGRFIVGGFKASENGTIKEREVSEGFEEAPNISIYNSTGSTGGQDEYAFTVNTMPPHVHRSNQGGSSSRLDHSHTVTVTGDHDHGINYGTSTLSQNGEMKVSMRRQKNLEKHHSGPTRDGLVAKLEVPENQAQIEINFNRLPDGSLMSTFPENQTHIEPVDNRPPHYIVVYLIKVDKGIYQGQGKTYNTPKAINY